MQGLGYDGKDHNGPSLENNNQLTKWRNVRGGGVGNCSRVLVGLEKERGEEKRRKGSKCMQLWQGRQWILCGRGDEWHNGEEHGEGEDGVVVVTVGRGNDSGCPIL